MYLFHPFNFKYILNCHDKNIECIIHNLEGSKTSLYNIQSDIIKRRNCWQQNFTSWWSIYCLDQISCHLAKKRGEGWFQNFSLKRTQGLLGKKFIYAPNELFKNSVTPFKSINLRKKWNRFKQYSKKNTDNCYNVVQLTQGVFIKMVDKHVHWISGTRE